MLGVLAHRDVDEPVVNHWRADEMVSVSASAEGVLRLFRIAVKLPEQLGLAVLAAGVERIEPAVAAAEEHLGYAAEFGVGRARPLAVEHVGTRRAVGPEHRAVALVEAEETRGLGVREIQMAFIDAIARVHEQEVAGTRHTAGAHVVLRDAELLHHVEHPDDVGLVLPLLLLSREGPVVLPVAKALGVEALHLAAAGDIPEPVAFHERRAADALQRPVVHPAGGEFLTRVLPEERAVGRVKGEQAAEVGGRGIPLQPALAVVGADERLAVGDHRIPVRLAAERRHPGDVLRGLRIPRAGVGVELARSPLHGEVLRVGHVVAARRTAPLVPLGGERRAGSQHHDHHPTEKCPTHFTASTDTLSM